MAKIQRSFILSIFIAIVALGGLVFFLHQTDEQYDLWALLIGDVFLGLLSIASFLIIKKGLKSDNGNAFVRAKYSSTLLKMFSSLILLLAYIFLNGRQIHKPTLFLFLGMYVVFSALEAVPLSKLAKIKEKI